MMKRLGVRAMEALAFNADAAIRYNRANSKDVLNHKYIPVPFSKKDASQFFKDYIAFINSQNPNIDLEKLENGKYLSDYLLDRNPDYHFITIAKVDAMVIGRLNEAEFWVEPMGNIEEAKEELERLHELGFDLLKQ